MKEKDLIIFDIDRTIYDGSIGQDFIIELINEGLISPKILANLSLELLEYELDLQTYSKTVRDALISLAYELNNQPIEKVREVAQKTIQYNHYKFYDYIFEIPKVFKDFDYVLLSLEPQILVSEIANYLKIPNYICNQFNTSNEKILRTEKIVTNKLDLFINSSFKDRKIITAFGDSENDLPILEQASLKIVVNPTPNLYNKINQDRKFIIANTKTIYDTFKNQIINFV